MAYVRVYAHDSNPEIDKPIHKVSMPRALEALAAGEVRRLPGEPMRVQNYPPRGNADIQVSGSERSDGCLNETITLANVGIAGAVGQPPDRSKIYYAQAKMRAFKSMQRAMTANLTREERA